MQHTQAIVYRFIRWVRIKKGEDNLTFLPNMAQINKLYFLSCLFNNNDINILWRDKIYPYIDKYWTEKAFKHFDEDSQYSTELKTYILKMYGCNSLKELEKIKCQKWHFAYPFHYWFINFKFKEEIMREWYVQIFQTIKLI